MRNKTGSYKFKQKFIVLNILFLLFLCFENALAIDLKEKFPQRINPEFFNGLLDHKNEPRAIFLDFERGECPLVVYAAYHPGSDEISH